MAMTNREFYQLVTGFESELPLEQYLRSVWALGCKRKGELIGIADVASILTGAFSIDAPAFDEAWRTEFAEPPNPTGEFVVDWEHSILFQIVELRMMAEDGTLDDDYRYYGLTSPNGGRWYNFDPLTYLECGVRGTVGGYETEEVIVLIPSDDGDDDSAVFELDEFGWEAFTDLLWCGQHYE